MKKILVSLILILVMLPSLFLTACTPKAEPAPAPEVDTPVTPDTVAPDTVAPDTVTPDTVTPDTLTPDTLTPDEPEIPDEPEANVVYDAAYAYFANFPSDSNVVRSADLFELMDAGEEMLILDIRRPDDYAENHLIGAVNLSFFDTSISDHIEQLPDDMYIMVYCYTGQTASQVTAILNIAGKMAKNIQSGYNNGISQAEGFEAYLETNVNELDGASYSVDSAILMSIQAYFADKMAQDGSPFANFNVSPDTVNTIVTEENDDYLIVSIRRAEDFAAGHIPTAINISYGQGMEKELAKLPTDKAIVIYCYSGQTSSQTTAVLRLMGFNAYSMSGGMGSAGGSGWLGAGYEVVVD